MKKFEIAKWNEFHKFNYWFHYCTKNQIPYVIIRTKIKYASVEWDYISLNTSHDVTLKSNAENNVELFFEIFRKYANRKSSCETNGSLFIAKNILIEDSNNLAEEIFDIVNNQLFSKNKKP